MATPMQISRFVNRDKQINVFTEAVRSIHDNAGQILTFYGVGGQGKTALFRELNARSEKAGIYEPILRKGVVSLSKEGPQQYFELVLDIRNALSKAPSRVRFPAFDLAFELFWKELHGSLPMPIIENPWWAGIRDVGSEAAKDSVENVAVAFFGEGTKHLSEIVPFLSPILRRLNRSVWDYGRKQILFKTNQALAPVLVQTDKALATLFHEEDIIPAYQIEAQLATVLAGDLRAWRETHPEDRFVVFVDGYENVLKAGGASDPRGSNPLDAAMRDLVARCRSTLFVVFSREKLRWDKIDSNTWLGVLDNRQFPLGGLSHTNAQDFLQRAGVSDGDVRIAMIKGASARDPLAGDPATCYPIMLDLQVKLFEALRESGKPLGPEHFRIDGDEFEGKRNELLALLLRNYPDSLAETLKRLAAPRHFNQALFNFTIDAFRTGLPRGHWPILIGLSIVQQGPTHETFAFHDVIREGLIAMMDDDSTASETHEALFKYFDSALQTDDSSNVTAEQAAIAAEAFYHKRSTDPRSALLWWREKAQLFHGRGIDRFVEQIDYDCIDIAADTYGRSSTRYVERLAWHAVNLVEQGRYAEGESLQRRALAISEESGGPGNHQAVAIISNLGLNLDSQGRHAEAEQYHRRALATQMKVRGLEHSDTASSLGYLASNLNQQGRYAEAEVLFWRALAVIGTKHRSAGTILDNLGLNLHSQGRTAEAEHWLRNALVIREKEFGADSFKTASTLRYLGYILDYNGNHQEAEGFLRRALAIHEIAPGPDHPSTAETMGFLAANLSHLLKYAEAKILFERALKVLSPMHRKTAAILNNLGSNFDFQGQHTDAEKPHREALEVNEKMLGPAHPATALSLAYLGTNLYHQGRYEMAEEFLRRALLIREKVFGTGHVETATTLSNVALNLDRQNRRAEAELLHQRAFRIRKEELGPEHPQTADAVRNLAANLDAQGKHAEAEELRRGKINSENLEKDPPIF